MEKTFDYRVIVFSPPANYFLATYLKISNQDQ